MTTRERPWLPDLALLSVAVIWGANIPIMKLALGEMQPLAFNAARLTVSALFLAAMVAWERRNASGAPTTARPTRWGHVLAVGLLGSFFYQLVFIRGIDRTTAGNTALIISSSPIWTALIARMAGTERIALGAWAGLGVAFAGTVWVTVEGGAVDLGTERVGGNLLVLAAAVLWAASTVASKSLVGQMSPTRLAFLTTASMVPLHIAVATPELGPIMRLEISPVTWACIAFSGMLSTGLAYALWNFGIQKVGPSHTAIYNNLVPVLALCNSVWILGETITAWQIIGGLLILGGLLIMRRARR